MTLTGYLPTRPKATRAVTAAVRAPWKSCTRLACVERAGVASAGPAHDSSLDAPVPVPVGRGGDSDLHPGGRPHDGGTARTAESTVQWSDGRMLSCNDDEVLPRQKEASACTSTEVHRAKSSTQQRNNSGDLLLFTHRLEDSQRGRCPDGVVAPGRCSTFP